MSQYINGRYDRLHQILVFKQFQQRGLWLFVHCATGMRSGNQTSGRCGCTQSHYHVSLQDGDAWFYRTPACDCDEGLAGHMQWAIYSTSLFSLSHRPQLCLPTFFFCSPFLSKFTFLFLPSQLSSIFQFYFFSSLSYFLPNILSLFLFFRLSSSFCSPFLSIFLLSFLSFLLKEVTSWIYKLQRNLEVRKSVVILSCMYTTCGRTDAGTRWRNLLNRVLANDE
jgi:hypothetical protein